MTKSAEQREFLAQEARKQHLRAEQKALANKELVIVPGANIPMLRAEFYGFVADLKRDGLALRNPGDARPADMQMYLPDGNHYVELFDLNASPSEAKVASKANVSGELGVQRMFVREPV